MFLVCVSKPEHLVETTNTLGEHANTEQKETKLLYWGLTFLLSSISATHSATVIRREFKLLLSITRVTL